MSPEAIHASDVHLFAPCALGAGLNQVTIPQMRARLVAGAANNQLATEADAALLHERGILYVPDFVANAGGIIDVAAEYLGHDRGMVHHAVHRIPGRLSQLLDRAEASRTSPAPTPAPSPSASMPSTAPCRRRRRPRSIPPCSTI
nr:hypothetical protein [Xanthobacter sp. 126]